MTESSFVRHREIEFALNAALTQLREIAQQLKTPETVSEVTAVQQRLTNHTFTLAVVGEFKRGKSTFINALLGKEILPADVVPTSATLNRVTYGLSPGVQVIMKATDETPEQTVAIPIDELADYVTKLTPDAESMAERVKEAVVYYPNDYCRNNVSIIDTPGLNDEAKMTEVTRSVLPQLDAALMVIMPNAPFAETEGEFLRELLENEVGRILFVVTAIDRVRRERDRESVLNLIRSRIVKAVEIYAAAKFPEGSDDYQLCLQRLGNPRIYPISGYDALIAKEENDEAALEKSGFAEFERVLERFLVEERGAVALRVVVEQVLNLTAVLQKTAHKRQENVLQERQALEARFADAQKQLAEQREQNERDLAHVAEAVVTLKEQVTPRLEQAHQDMLVAVQTTIDQAAITPTDLTQATRGAATSALSSWGKGLLKGRQKSPWKDRAEGMLDSLSESGRVPVFEQLTQDIGQNVQAISQQITSEIEKEIGAALTKEEQRLQGVETQSAENLFKTQVMFRDDVKAAAEVETETAVVPIQRVTTDWNNSLHLTSLNSAAASSLNSAKEILSEMWESVKKRVRREEHEGQWTTHDRVSSFKENYKARIATELAAQLEKNDLQGEIEQMIEERFSTLKTDVAAKLEKAVLKTESHIANLRDEQIRGRALSEQEATRFTLLQSQLKEMKQQMTDILTQLLAILGKYGQES